MNRVSFEKLGRMMRAGIVFLGLLLLYLPIAMMVASSFNSASHGTIWQGGTLRWYRALFQNIQILEALKTSLMVAGCSALLSCPLGVLLGLGLARQKGRGNFFVKQTAYLPMIVPDIVMGISLLVFFSFLSRWISQLNLGLWTMVAAHMTSQIPFVALIIQNRMRSMDPALLEAARDLGANRWRSFWCVTFPLLWPGVMAGLLLAFTLSIDDFIVSFFTSGAGTTTLPIFIYASVKRGLTPEIHALSSLLVFTSAITTITVLFLQRSGRKGLHKL